MFKSKKSFYLFVFYLFFGNANYAGAAIYDSEFYDTARNRTVPYKLYTHENTSAPAPVVIFSHGLGGSTAAAPYLGKALAAHGYYAFFIQHPGSDKSIWEGIKNPLKIKRSLKSGMTAEAANDRYNDIPFVIDEIIRLNKAEGPLKGKLNTDKIGMAGHSFGARGVLMAAGEKSMMRGKAYKDPRIKAFIALSPNVPEYAMKMPNYDITSNYTNINAPVFHMTGTKDAHPFDRGFDPLTRTKPYQFIQASNQYLLVLDGADHATFGGGHRRRSGTDSTRYQDAVAAGAILFLDAYLKGDANAKNELRQNYPQTLSAGDHFEYK